MFNLKKIFSSWNKKGYSDFIPLDAIWTSFGSKWEIKEYTEAELMFMMKWWVFDCVDVIWDSMANLQRDFYSNDKMTKKVASEYKEFDSFMLKAIAIYLKTIGVAYILKEKVGNRKKISLLYPQHVQEHKQGLYKIIKYTYSDGNNTWTFSPDEIVKIETFTPFSDKWGLSPLKAVATQVAMDMSSVEYNRLFFDNGGRPGVVFKKQEAIDTEVKEKFIRSWKLNFGGLKNSNKVAFLDQWVDIHDFSQNQKDMDFVNQRTFTKDEVLMAFRVPKPLLGKSDGVGFADKKVPEHYFLNYTIKPLAKMLEEKLNRDLFEKSFLFFTFPQDKDELLKDYQNGTITLNEYRTATGRQPLSNGDTLTTGETATIQEEKKEVENNIISKSFQNAFKGLTFGSEEYNQKSWEKKISRTDKYEKEMAGIQEKIWNVQLKEIEKNLKDSKAIKKIEKEDDLFNAKQMQILYLTLYTSFYKDMMTEEGNIAISEISDEAFAIAQVNKWIWENIEKMSKEIDDVTRKEMFKIIQAGNKEGLWATAISKNIRDKFKSYTKKDGRVDNIARTEVTRASNKSQDEAYIQSGVVEKKEWFTAIDERVCPFCNDLHKKRVWIKEEFFKKWDTHLGQKVSYEDIWYPPRHPRCRCTIRPIISRKYFENFEKRLQWKGLLFNK